MDSDIRAAVHKELVTDPLIDAGDIVVVVFDGEVSLKRHGAKPKPAFGGGRGGGAGGCRDRGA